ncbi:hypothetical protein P7C71_g5527, partial [Lecanoromycetidae sp. Uapishka_2]
MSSANTVILITGANRGIGLGLVSEYLLKPSHTVIAAVRDPHHPTALALSTLPKGHSSVLITVKLDSAIESDAASAVHTIATAHAITALDIVVANAGISRSWPKVADADLAGLREHFEINVLGPLALFKATLPLLEKANAPKFVTMSSGAGSIGGMEMAPIPNSSYGPSKAALNYLTRKMHFEHEWLIAFPIDPGWVQTEMGNTGARHFGMEKAYTSVEDCVKGVVNLVSSFM